MDKNYILLFEAGLEGGGFTLYTDSSGIRCYESGSFMGIKGEIEDSEWSKEYPSWEHFWTEFSQNTSLPWYRFHVQFAHERLHGFLSKQLINLYQSDNHKEGVVKKWLRRLDLSFELPPPSSKILSDVADTFSGRICKSDFIRDEGHLQISASMISRDQELIIKRPRFYDLTELSRFPILQSGDLVIISMGSQDRLTDYIIYDLPYPAFAGVGTFLIRPTNPEYFHQRWPYKRHLLKTIIPMGANHTRLLKKDLDRLEL